MKIESLTFDFHGAFFIVSLECASVAHLKKPSRFFEVKIEESGISHLC